MGIWTITCAPPPRTARPISSRSLLRYEKALCSFAYNGLPHLKDTRSKGRQDYHELTSVSQTACNIQGVISPDGAVNSQTHLVSSAREADTAHLEDSQPSLDSLGIPWGIRIDNLFDSAIFWIFLAGLITYTLATMIVIAYYLAWHIGPETYPGIKAGIAMGAIGVFAALSPLYHDYQRLRHPV